MGIIRQIWTGRAGLARTYWLYGVVVSFGIGFALTFVTPGSVSAKLMLLPLLAYFIILSVGIWRSASLYEGPKVWAVLAKMAVAAWPAILIVGTILGLVLPMVDTREQQKAVKSSDAEWWKQDTPVGPAKQEVSPYPGLKPFTGKLDGE